MTWDFKIQCDGNENKRHLKGEFEFLQFKSRLFLPTYFVKCRRTLLELNSYEPCSEREIKFRLHLFMFSLKRKIGHFHVLVVQNSQKNYKKSVKHLLPTEPIGCFLTFSLPSRRWMLKFLLYKRTHSPTLHNLHLEVSPLTDKF